MNILNLTSSTENLLKCAFCKNYLSHFPVYLSPQKENVCSRCTLSDEKYLIRNVAYETISGFLLFPCIYDNEGCTRKLLPKNVPQHEKVCNFRVIKCPSSDMTKCDWTGPCLNLLEHCHNRHSDLILLENADLQVDLSNSNDIIKFLEYEGRLFTFNMKNNSPNKSFQCAVYYMDSEVNLASCWCVLNINNGKRQEFRATASSNIKFTEFPHDNKFFIGKIVLQKFPTENKQNTELINLLKCYICTKYAFPSISQCTEKGLVICSECKKQHSAECDCWTQFGREIKNFNLDNIARLLTYPCVNRKSGCDYVGKHDHVEKHQQSCNFAEMDCPVHEYISCVWKGLEQEVAAHIKQSHQNILLKNSHIISTSTFSAGYLYCKLIAFDNRWFRLVFTQVNKVFYWSVQMMGGFESNFRYEVVLLDKNGDEKLIMGNSCSPSIQKHQLLEDDQNYCHLFASQISWLNPYNLRFSVRVLRR